MGCFNGKLKGIRESLALLGGVCRTHDRPSNRVAYRKYKHTYQDAIKEAKRSPHDKTIDSSRNSVKCMWNIINVERNTIRKNELCNCTKTPEELNYLFLK